MHPSVELVPPSMNLVPTCNAPLPGPCWPAVPPSGCGSAGAGKRGLGTAVYTGGPTAADGSHTSQGARATCESTGTEGQAHGWTPRELEFTSCLVCDLRRVWRLATLMWWCWAAHWASCWQPHCWHTAAGTVGKARRSRCVWLLWSGASWLGGSRNGTAPKPTCRSELPHTACAVLWVAHHHAHCSLELNGRLTTCDDGVI